MPIVALTANVQPKDREACLATGMDGYLSKPVRLDDLRAAIERWGAAALGPRASFLRFFPGVHRYYRYLLPVMPWAVGWKLPDCDLVVVVTWGVDLHLRELAAQQLPRATVLSAGYPTVVLER